MLVVAGLEINLWLLDQPLVEHGFEPVRRPDRRYGSGSAVVENFRNAFFGGEPHGPAELLTQFTELHVARARQHGQQQVFTVVYQ